MQRAALGAFCITPQILPGPANATSHAALTYPLSAPDLAVVERPGRGLQAMDGTAVGIHAHIGFHPKISVVALLPRRHLGVANSRLIVR
jgi:hypothetical protein